MSNESYNIAKKIILLRDNNIILQKQFKKFKKELID
jgi:hypothetical protein